MGKLNNHPFDEFPLWMWSCVSFFKAQKRFNHWYRLRLVENRRIKIELHEQQSKKYFFYFILRETLKWISWKLDTKRIRTKMKKCPKLWPKKFINLLRMQKWKLKTSSIISDCYIWLIYNEISNSGFFNILIKIHLMYFSFKFVSHPV